MRPITRSLPRARAGRAWRWRPAPCRRARGRSRTRARRRHRRRAPPAGCSRRFTISCTCSFFAWPLPTTACFTCSAVYSETGSVASTAAQIAAPRAWPSSSVDCGFTFTKTFSTATSTGRVARDHLGEALEDGREARAAAARASSRADAPARHVGEPRAVLLDHAIAGDAEAGVDAEDAHAPPSEDRARTCSESASSPALSRRDCAQDALERRSRTSRPRAGSRRCARPSDLEAARAQARRARTRASASVASVAIPLARARGADPVADLELGHRPVDGVQAALAHEQRRRACGTKQKSSSSRASHLRLRLARQCSRSASSDLHLASPRASRAAAARSDSASAAWSAAPWPARVARSCRRCVSRTSGMSSSSAWSDARPLSPRRSTAVV